MPAITTTGLCRRFGDIEAVSDLSVEIPTGQVIGFVGPNGSGKSTTIRMLLGLVRPTRGTGKVLGHSISHPEEFAHKVGALVENPAFEPGLSARQNLRSICQLRGLPRKRIDAVLDQVDLQDRADEPVKGFSLGMKQRLGIAIALLPDPELLILDEPTNGLDPAGIVQVRELFRQLRNEGRTVLVSSHLLSEIEAACDHVVMIRKGKLLFQGDLADLLDAASEHIEIKSEDSADLAQLAGLYQRAGWTARLKGPEIWVQAPLGRAAELNRIAAEQGITLQKLNGHRDTLEEVFLTMTADEHPFTNPGATSPNTPEVLK